MLTAQMVKEAALSLGADLVGIGSMKHFEGAPKDFDVRYMYPKAKTIIGLGFRIHRGLLRPMEEGTHFGTYPSIGYANINDVHMPVVLRELGSFIEDHGYEAVIYNNSANRYGTSMGVPVKPGYPKPNVMLHFRIAGVICGMGEIGWSNIFLSPKFGPRQRLAFIITDAELETDPILEPSLCDKCMRCVKDCPSKAIPKDESVNFTIDGKTYEYAKLRDERCWTGFQLGNEEINPFLYDGSKESELSRWIMNTVYNDESPDKQRKIHAAWASWDFLKKNHMPSEKGMQFGHHPGTMCGATCIRTCMIHLEQQNKLENKFVNQFRIRKPWRLDPEKLLNEINTKGKATNEPDTPEVTAADNKKSDDTKVEFMFSRHY